MFTYSERLKLILKKIIISLFLTSCLDEIGPRSFRWLLFVWEVCRSINHDWFSDRWQKILAERHFHRDTNRIPITKQLFSFILSLFFFHFFQSGEVVAAGGRSSAEAQLLQDDTFVYALARRLPGWSSTASTMWKPHRDTGRYTRKDKAWCHGVTRFTINAFHTGQVHTQHLWRVWECLEIPWRRCWTYFNPGLGEDRAENLSPQQETAGSSDWTDSTEPYYEILCLWHFLFIFFSVLSWSLDPVLSGFIIWVTSLSPISPCSNTWVKFN